MIATIATAKRAAKRIRSLSRDRLSLSAAQGHLAAALGYRDWHELDARLAEDGRRRPHADVLRVLAERTGLPVDDLRAVLGAEIGRPAPPRAPDLDPDTDPAAPGRRWDWTSRWETKDGFSCLLAGRREEEVRGVPGRVHHVAAGAYAPDGSYAGFLAGAVIDLDRAIAPDLLLEIADMVDDRMVDRVDALLAAHPDAAAGSVALIGRVVVAEDRRGRGLGTALTSAALAGLKRRFRRLATAAVDVRVPAGITGAAPGAEREIRARHAAWAARIPAPRGVAVRTIENFGRGPFEVLHRMGGLYAKQSPPPPSSGSFTALDRLLAESIAAQAEATRASDPNAALDPRTVALPKGRHAMRGSLLHRALGLRRVPTATARAELAALFRLDADAATCRRRAVRYRRVLDLSTLPPREEDRAEDEIALVDEVLLSLHVLGKGRPWAKTDPKAEAEILAAVLDRRPDHPDAAFHEASRRLAAREGEPAAIEALFEAARTGGFSCAKKNACACLAHGIALARALERLPATARERAWSGIAGRLALGKGQAARLSEIAVPIAGPILMPTIAGRHESERFGEALDRLLEPHRSRPPEVRVSLIATALASLTYGISGAPQATIAASLDAHVEAIGPRVNARPFVRDAEGIPMRSGWDPGTAMSEPVLRAAFDVTTDYLRRCFDKTLIHVPDANVIEAALLERIEPGLRHGVAHMVKTHPQSPFWNPKTHPIVFVPCLGFD